MSFLYPLFAAILQAASFTIDKITLSVRKVTYKTYTFISFPLIFIFNFVVFLIFRPPLSLEFFTLNSSLLILLVIFISIVTNIFFYRALKSDKLSELEALTLLNKLSLILLASLFFPAERNIFTISLALVAALSVIWSHWERRHFNIAKKTLPFLIWTVLISPFGGIIQKNLLETWNPISLQLVINGFLALFFLGVFHKKVNKIPGRALPLLLLTNLLTSVAWILYFFSYKVSGIIFTVLIFSLQPLLVYLASFFLLNEKTNWKKVAAFFIIIISIILAKAL